MDPKKAMYQLLSPLRPDELRALEDDIRQRGVQIPIEVDEAGAILDGHHRFEIATRLGIDCPRIVRTFKTEEEKREHVLKLNLARRHLADHQWGAAFARLLELRNVKRKPGRPREEDDNCATIAQLSGAAGISRRTVHYRLAAAKQFEALPADLKAKVESGDLTLPAAVRLAETPTETPTAHVRHNSGAVDWYTPADFVEAARNVMGGIDLDPASCDEANEVVKATTIYTVDDDGLTKDWTGRVWMNPPYSSVDRFCEKLVASLPEIVAAIVLTNNATETAWWQCLCDHAAAIAFPKGRIRFWRKDQGVAGAPLQGQTICYVGDTPHEFMSEFSRFGMVLRK